MMKSVTETNGARLLKDIENEKCTLEDLLKDLRTLHPAPQSKTGIPALDALIPHTPHHKTTTISGHHLPLVHHLIYHQVRTLSGTVCLLDLTSTFSPSYLISSPSHALTLSELSHIHVFPCTKSNLQATLKSLEGYMLYEEGSKGSRGREWVATIVLGGQGGDFGFVWRGNWRVEREWKGETGFGAAASVEEAWVEEGRRREGRDEKQWEGGRWRVVSEGGSYAWKDD